MRADEITESIRFGSVPSSWLTITNRMDVAGLLRLQQAVQEKDVDPHDHAAVKAVWDDLVANAHQQVSDLDDETARDFAEYQARVQQRASRRDKAKILTIGS